MPIVAVAGVWLWDFSAVATRGTIMKERSNFGSACSSTTMPIVYKFGLVQFIAGGLPPGVLNFAALKAVFSHPFGFSTLESLPSTRG